MLAEEMADFGGGAVFVVRLGLHHQGDAAGTIPLVGDFLDGAAALEFAGAFFDGPVDVVHGHGFRPGGGDGGAEAGVEAGVAPAEAGGHGDFLGQLGKERAAFDIGGAFRPFDFCPVTVAGHGPRLGIDGGGCRVWGIAAGRMGQRGMGRSALHRSINQE